GRTRCDPASARTRCALLERLARGDAARGRGRTAGAVGSRLVGGGDERRVAAAARRAPLSAAARGSQDASLRANARVPSDGDAGPVVARAGALPGPAGS